MTHDDIIDLLSYAAAFDRRTVGKFDVLAWYDLIGDLPKDLALQAARDHYREQPGVWLEPGHIVAGVRAIRRDQFERAHDRHEYEAKCDAKALDTITTELTQRNPDMRPALPGNPIPGDDTPRRQFLRPVVNPLSVPCPTCRAPTAWLCRRHGRSPGYHRSRIDAVHAQPKTEAPERNKA